MKGEILFLAHRIPFPPDRGDKIRSHHLLQALSRLAPVHVACLADDAADLAQEPALAALAASHCLELRRKPLMLAGAEALLRRQPVSLTAFHHRGLARYVRKVLASRPIGAIYVFSGQMGQYVPAGFSGRLVMDFVDADSAKFEAYARAGHGLRHWIDAREARLLQAEEARLATRADVSLLVTAAERTLFAARLDAGLRDRIRLAVLPNGIDAQSFDPARVAPEPKLQAGEGPHLIFTGQMDYAPNHAAALRAIDRIMPRIRVVLPQATFHVVGRNPAAELRARQGVNGACIQGQVDDIRPWLRGADLALVPLEIARGVQNKVLEAMAMALPVVLSPEAAAGIEAADGTDFLIGNDDCALAAAAIALLLDQPRKTAMGLAARRWAVARASWEAALAELPGLLGLEAKDSADAG